MASSISGWTEGILLSLAFVAILTLILMNFNVMYDQNNSLGLTDKSTQAFIDYNDQAKEQIEGGEVELGQDSGITLKSSYGITKDVIKIIWSFISGGWIEKIVDMWGLGEAGTAIARVIRIIYFLSLVFALLYTLFKIII